MRPMQTSTAAFHLDPRLVHFMSSIAAPGADEGEPKLVGFDKDRRVNPMDDTSYSGERYISASLAAATKAFRIT